MTTARRATWAAALLLALHLGGAPARAEGVVLDDFETLAGWTTVASEGARVWTLQEPGHSGMGMRVGFELGAGGGYVIVHKQVSLPLPENYTFTFYLRGEGGGTTSSSSSSTRRERTSGGGTSATSPSPPTGSRSPSGSPA